MLGQRSAASSGYGGWAPRTAGRASQSSYMQYLEEELDPGLASDRPHARGDAAANVKSSARSGREAEPALQPREAAPLMSYDVSVKPHAATMQVDEDDGAEDGEIVE